MVSVSNLPIRRAVCRHPNMGIRGKGLDEEIHRRQKLQEPMEEEIKRALFELSYCSS